MYTFWFYNSQLSVWDGDECNRLRGTDSTIFPPFLEPDDGLWTYTPDICMSLKAHYVRKSTYAGLPTSIYSINFGGFEVRSVTLEMTMNENKLQSNLLKRMMRRSCAFVMELVHRREQLTYCLVWDLEFMV